MHEFLRGVADLGRGFRLWGSSPRLMLLGALPALIVGAIWVALLVGLVTSVDGVAAWATGFADGWNEPFRTAVRVAAAFAILVLAVVVGALSFTAVVLTVGDPFYERISRRVEQRLGDPPEERDEPVLRGLLRPPGTGSRSCSPRSASDSRRSCSAWSRWSVRCSAASSARSSAAGSWPSSSPAPRSTPADCTSATAGGAWAASAFARSASASRPGCCS